MALKYSKSLSDLESHAVLVICSQEKRKTAFGDAVAFTYQQSGGNAGVKDSGVLLVPERYLLPSDHTFPSMAVYWGKYTSKNGRVYNKMTHIHPTMIPGDVMSYAQALAKQPKKEIERLLKVPTLSEFEALTMFVLTSLHVVKPYGGTDEGDEPQPELPCVKYEQLDRKSGVVIRKGMLYLPERLTDELQKRVPCAMLYRGLRKCQGNSAHSFHDVFLMSPTDDAKKSESPATSGSKKKHDKEEPAKRKSTSSVKTTPKYPKITKPKLDPTEESQAVLIFSSDDDDC